MKYAAAACRAARHRRFPHQQASTCRAQSSEPTPRHAAHLRRQEHGSRRWRAASRSSASEMHTAAVVLGCFEVDWTRERLGTESHYAIAVRSPQRRRARGLYTDDPLVSNFRFIAHQRLMRARKEPFRDEKRRVTAEKRVKRKSLLPCKKARHRRFARRRGGKSRSASTPGLH